MTTTHPIDTTELIRIEEQGSRGRYGALLSGDVIRLVNEVRRLQNVIENRERLAFNDAVPEIVRERDRALALLGSATNFYIQDGPSAADRGDIEWPNTSESIVNVSRQYGSPRNPIQPWAVVTVSRAGVDVESLRTFDAQAAAIAYGEQRLRDLRETKK